MKFTDKERKRSVDSSVINDMEAVRSNLLDKGIVYFSVIFPLGLILSLLRTLEHGWNSVYWLHLSLSVLLITIAVFRKKLSYHVRGGLLLGMWLILATAGLIAFGLLGGGVQVFMLFVFMTTIVFGLRAGLFACLFTLGIVGIVGMAIVNKTITFSFDIKEFATSITAWSAMLILFFLFVPVFLIAIVAVQNHLARSLQGLRESHATHKRLVDNLVDTFLYRHDAEGVFTYVSSSITQVLGYSNEEFLVHFSEYLTKHPVNKEALKYSSQNLKGVRSPPYELQIFHKDGSHRWLRVSESPIYDDKSGKVIAVEGVAHDISGIKHGENALREKENFISNIINSMPSLLVGVTTDGNISHWNIEAEQKTGLSVEDAVGKSLDKAIPRFAREMNRVQQAIQERQKQSISKMEHQENGEMRYEDITIYPLIANCVQGAVIRIDDVTDKVRMEEMMIQSEKMLSVGGLAAGMAHEINNPLAGLMQTADVVANRLHENIEMPANQKVAEEIGVKLDDIKTFMVKRGIPPMFETINESGKRVSEIIHNMLSFARKGKALVSSHNMGKLFDKTLELAATDYDLKKQYDFKRIEVKKEYQKDIPLVPCEGTKIQQVFLNLLRNGAQAMQHAGVEMPIFYVRTRLDEERNMVVLELEDNGPGMDGKIKKRIFEPFFTTKPEGVGTGLGLSVSYFIVTENHGGEMGVESNPGKGSKFIVSLPVKGVNKSAT